MLADAEDVEADLVGERDLLEEVAHALLGTDVATQLGEAVDADLDNAEATSSLAHDNDCVGMRGEPGTHA